MKKLWILNHHSGLEGDRHYELAKELVLLGVEIVVFMSSYSHGREQYVYEEEVKIRKVKKGITYVYLHTAPAYHGISVRRILNMMDYCVLMRKYEKQFYRLFGRPDLVIGSSVHPFVWESAWRIARGSRAPFICEIRDFWPLSLTEIFGKSKYHPACLMFAPSCLPWSSATAICSGSRTCGRTGSIGFPTVTTPKRSTGCCARTGRSFRPNSRNI